MEWCIKGVTEKKGFCLPVKRKNIVLCLHKVKGCFDLPIHCKFYRPFLGYSLVNYQEVS